MSERDELIRDLGDMVIGFADDPHVSPTVNWARVEIERMVQELKDKDNEINRLRDLLRKAGIVEFPS